MAGAPPPPSQQRVCANCKCKETPLWRRSPLGPKTLCNACGVRMKKGRLVFVSRSAGFVTVESPAAVAKRQRKEREARESAAAHARAQPHPPDLHPATLHPQHGIAKSNPSSRRRGKPFKGASGLYYLLAAIEFVETS